MASRRSPSTSKSSVAALRVTVGLLRVGLLRFMMTMIAMTDALALGMSLNTVSLFALVLAIGIVVDDAIVVVENVERLIAEEGLPPKQATAKAMVQITGPVIATTLVLLAVFVPVTFMPGITGRLFTQFAVTISVAVVISSINALTLSPALCGMFLRPRSGPPRGLLALFERVIDTTRNGYVAIVSRLVRASLIGVVAVAGAVVVIVVLGGRLPTGWCNTRWCRCSCRCWRTDAARGTGVRDMAASK